MPLSDVLLLSNNCTFTRRFIFLKPTGKVSYPNALYVRAIVFLRAIIRKTAGRSKEVADRRSDCARRLKDRSERVPKVGF